MLASTSGCGLLSGEEESSNASGETTKVKVSIMPTIDLAPFHLAAKNGYFKEEGLDVEIVNAPSGQASVTKMIAGEVDISYSSYTPFFIAEAGKVAEKDGNIKIVADASSAAPGSTMVVAMPDSPVKKVTDLPGKKIAITGQNTICDTLIKSVMKTNGLDFNGIQWVDIPFPEMSKALANGEVDAAFMTEPFITQSAKTVGSVPVVDTASGPTQDFPTAGYASLGKFANENPKAVGAFQRALQKATVESEDRSKIEPLMVEFSKVDADTAALTKLLQFQSKPDPSRLQRVPDLLLEFGTIGQALDVEQMIAKATDA
ncbi:sulfonate ABC transporter substrate-binding protein [Amycolatopsis antarctica]|uniref:Sulfonate ABC transporter substrate-binding protein n=2 Tax=Amycolatopsis antarctica TaxID=1854586 RepID=A0A263CXC7_9PSEU|nr:sulfonate ABC transporter substrate-binding protein [Amycolatopsis antarctica]